MMNPLDVKKKVLGAVKGYGREGMGEHLKKGYGKPAVAIKIESTKIEPEMEEGEVEEMDDNGMPMKEAMHEMAEGEKPEMGEKAEGMESEGEGKAKLTPELLEMLLAKLGK